AMALSYGRPCAALARASKKEIRTKLLIFPDLGFGKQGGAGASAICRVVLSGGKRLTRIWFLLCSFQETAFVWRVGELCAQPLGDRPPHRVGRLGRGHHADMAERRPQGCRVR